MAPRDDAGFLKQTLNAAEDKAGELAGRAKAALTADAQDFVTRAAISDLYEIEAGRIAQARATSDGVRQAGGRMVKDHIEIGRRTWWGRVCQDVEIPVVAVVLNKKNSTTQ